MKNVLYLIEDLDRWAYSLNIPKILNWLVIFVYPATWVVIIYRYGRFVESINNKIIRIPFYIVYFIVKRLSEIIFGIEISSKADIGPGFYIAHLGSIVIGMGCVAGKNLSVRQGVTLGGSGTNGTNHPKLGDNVLIGAGAVVIGGVSIGNNVLIGANSVVTKDIPTEARVVGVPSKVINFNGTQGIVNTRETSSSSKYK